MEPAIRTPQVPYDLLHPIFKHLENHTTSLCALSLASSAFRDEAQRILFKNVTTLKGYMAHIKFLWAVAASPTRLALFVHSYNHRFRFGDSGLNVILRDVEAGLKAMCHLKQLDVGLSASSLHMPRVQTVYVQILSSCTFSLERFSWLAKGLKADELAEKFFPRQPTLGHLSMYCDGTVMDPLSLVPPTTCPNLISVMSAWPIISALLPRRRISTLRFDDDYCGITEADVKPLEIELKYVKALSIPFSFLLEPKLPHQGILKYFPSLNILEIYNIEICFEYDDWDGEDQEELEGNDKVTNTLFKLFIADLSHMLSHFPELQTLILSDPLGRPWEGIELTRLIFADFGTHLKCIDIESDYKTYRRYIHTQEIIQEISKTEVRKLWPPTAWQ